MARFDVSGSFAILRGTTASQTLIKEPEMSLYKYCSSFYGLMEEITLSLSQEYNIDLLADIMKENMSEEDWGIWMFRNEKRALTFLSQTPKQREKKPVWDTDDEKPLIMLTALVLARKACIFTEESERLSNIIGLSYREALSNASQRAQEICYQLRLLWPFPGEDPWGNINQFN